MGLEGNPENNLKASRWPLVGIGASAGGLDAFTRFFQRMPAGSGMAFVLVQHLDPRHESIMPELLARHTAMPVVSARDGVRIEPNTVYVLQPSETLTVRDGVLHVEAQTAPPGHRLPIDDFLHSLASDRGPEAVGIVLCGLGSDGTRGLLAVREAGGLTLVQDPRNALHPEMPRSAILAGAADHVVSVEEMPDLLLAHGQQLRQMPLGTPARRLLNEAAARLPDICELLRRRTGHDFSRYRRSTILRRVHRRMQVLHMASVEQYVQRLGEEEEEAGKLFNELLINVTRFFRDAEAFALLEQQVIPAILEGKGHDGQVRIWVPGCASGEEAYSIAMLVMEQASRMEHLPHVQIFASDIDEEMLAIARHGRYPESIAQQVSAERLQRFFTHQGGAYQVCRELRDSCLFSRHDVTRDPPFSGLDLVSCRNLLIYMEGELQRKLLPLFHYALLPGGYLFLGPSESVASHGELFLPLEKKERLYRRRDTVIRPAVEFPTSRRGRAPAAATAQAMPTMALPAGELSPVRAIERLLLEQFAPAGVVVREEGEVVYFVGRLDRYLALPAGLPSANLLNMARAGLRAELRMGLRRAARTRQAVVLKDLPVDTGTGFQPVKVTIQPLSELGGDAAWLLVVFQEAGPLRTPGEAAEEGLTPVAEEPAVQQLENELRNTRERLQATVEDLEAANEALTSSNEELISMNEELQSANEELQTSKEEVQSANEELGSLNAELQRKLEELDRANSDLQNLFQSTQIATIFLDRELRITRYTPASRDIFRLIGSDVGRPIMDIAPRFVSGDLAAEIREVLTNVSATERPICLLDAQTWFIMRILPYRTIDNAIDGVVLTFTDITELKKSETEIRSLAQFPQENPNPVIRSTASGRVLFANMPGHLMLTNMGWASGSPLPEPLLSVLPDTLRAAHPREIELPCPVDRIYLLLLAPITSEGYVNIYGTDITERKRTEKALHESEAQNAFLAGLVRDSSQPVGVGYPDGRLGMVNQAFEHLTGYTTEELGSLDWSAALTPPEWRQMESEKLAELRRTGQPVRYEKEYLRKDGTRVPIELLVHMVADASGQPQYYYSFLTDISERKAAEERLREREERLRLFIEHAPAALAMFDTQMRYISVSQRWLIDYGLEGRELRGLSHYEVFPEIPEQWKEAHRRALGGEVVRADEDPFQRADGKVQWLKWEVRPWLDASGMVAGIVIFSVDITEQKAAGMQLQMQMEQLRQANEDLNRFNRVAVGRELRMIELKKQVNAMAARLGEPPPYAIAGMGEQPDE